MLLSCFLGSTYFLDTKGSPLLLLSVTSKALKWIVGVGNTLENQYIWETCLDIILGTKSSMVNYTVVAYV